MMLPTMFAFSQENEEVPLPAEQKEEEKQEEYVSIPVFKTERFDDFREYLNASVKYPYDQAVKEIGGVVRVKFDVNEDDWTFRIYISGNQAGQGGRIGQLGEGTVWF